MLRRGLLLCCAVLFLGSCAWVFQERLPSHHKPSHVPRCSTTKALVALDGVFAVLNGITALAALSIEARTDEDNVLLVSSAIWTIVHTSSAVSGNGWANECRRAQDEWDENERKKDELDRMRMQRTLGEPAAPTPAVQPPPAPPIEKRPRPRGFYCASSASQPLVGLCTRDSDACIRASAALSATAPDVSRCRLEETAHCFDAGSGDAEERCAPSEDACVAQYDRAVADGTNPGECVETQ